MIVVSHRGPFSFTEQPDGTFDTRRGAGGVVSALGPLLARAEGRAIWIAAALSDGDRAAVSAGSAHAPEIDLHLLALEPRMHRLHYDIVSNAVLWFLHHGLFDLVRRPSFDRRFREAWDAYVEVNREFAGAVCETAVEGEVVLVNDYQLALVPGFVRAARPDVRVVHFTHTPFCGPTSIRVLPADVSRDLCASMAGGPAGFHTTRWARSYAASAREVLGDEAPVGSAFAASLGPDADELAEVGASADVASNLASLDELVGDRAVILRSDRVEPSKNIVRGFAAYDCLLEQRPDLRGRVVFVAMVYPSRQGLADYLAYDNEVAQAVARVNERWATGDWEPIALDVRDDFARSVAGFQRYDVLLVNPTKDGLNLVAKEGPLLNRRDGALCLSREAGAFDELRDAAFEVHPFDVDQTAAALGAALDLAPEERTARASRLRELASARTPADWLDDLLAHAGRSRPSR